MISYSTKVCLGACGENLPLSAFGVSLSGKLGRRARCHRCRADEAVIHRKMNPPSFTEEQRKTRREASKRWSRTERGKEIMRGHNRSAKAKARRKLWHQTTEGKQSQKKGSRRLHEKRRAWLQAEKMRRGCIDCGYNEHPAALDFDHVSGVKHFIISKNVGRCIEALQAEIAKCVVRCSRCHRIKTFETRQSGQNKLTPNPPGLQHESSIV